VMCLTIPANTRLKPVISNNNGSNLSMYGLVVGDNQSDYGARTYNFTNSTQSFSATVEPWAQSFQFKVFFYMAVNATIINNLTVTIALNPSTVSPIQVTLVDSVTVNVPIGTDYNYIRVFNQQNFYYYTITTRSPRNFYITADNNDYPFYTSDSNSIVSGNSTFYMDSSYYDYIGVRKMTADNCTQCGSAAITITGMSFVDVYYSYIVTIIILVICISVVCCILTLVLLLVTNTILLPWVRKRQPRQVVIEARGEQSFSPLVSPFTMGSSYRRLETPEDDHDLHTDSFEPHQRL